MTAQLIFNDTCSSGDDVNRRALQLAGGLAQMDVAEGDVVAVMLRNDPAYIEIMQGARIAGCYCCQVNWHFKADEVGYILNDSGTHVLFIDEDLLASVAAAIPSTVMVLPVRVHGQADAARGPADYRNWLAAQAPYAGPQRAPRGNMAYTSGTTGRPKGVRRLPVPAGQQASQLQRVLAVVSQTLGIAPGVRALISAPLYHSAAGLFAQQAMLHGECLVLGARFDAEQTLALIERHSVQVAYLVPVMYVRMLRLAPEVRARYDLSSLTFVASTGAPCAPEIKRAMIDWLGPVIYETYASSETGLLTVADSETALRKPGCAGRPVCDATIRIYDADGKPCAPGEVGIVYARQPAYADFTYNNNDAARRAIERDGLISVGDMGYLDDEGDLYICDRASDMVISGGVNIYPSEIEHALIELPGVADCVVFGIPDDEYGESLAAHVTSEPGVQLDAAAIAAALRERIAGYKVPRRIEIVDSLPRDDNGKIARRKIRDRYWQNRQSRI
ncbi:MAG: long-chain fatty acid--CoA ligase [Burkholderiales bacterium RIFCSPLOWO2_02_FULL_57_36]|nr:MAG: long-chain fatty acid--CoA ligase [Burkholderiales bacterium RIFCSPLOWO2_02_FULL_57_36]